MARASIARLLRSIVALMAWAGLGIQLYLLVSNTPENGLTAGEAVGRFLLYFTILSNLLVAIYTSFAGRHTQQPGIATALALYILVVGLVYNLVLRQLWQPAGWQRVADELLHVVVPVFYILYWYFFIAARRLMYRAAIGWLSYPAMYLIYALLRGSREHFYPYFFIDPTAVGTRGVVQNAILLLLAFLGLGCGFVWLARAKKQPV